MQSLDHLVKAGKVLYLGVSDTPAWVVTKANQYARDHGLRQFSVYQGMYNAAKRDAEREILPMLRDEGMAFAPWAALGGGKFKTKEQVEAMEKAGDKGRAFGGPIKGKGYFLAKSVRFSNSVEETYYASKQLSMFLLASACS
jgi:aryl-alcohol dehydrogenase-like predicted oxidoreductase